jgi:hypothetical protein
MKEQESTKLEFLLTLNDNIVVQRFFNVRGFIHKSKNSLDLYEYMNDVVDSLHYDLKMKTVVYLLDNKESIIHDPSVMETSFTEGPEVFNLVIRYGDQVICHRQIDAKLYPPKVRYTVDIRPFLKEVLKELTDIFSSNNLTYDYLGYELSR